MFSTSYLLLPFDVIVKGEQQKSELEATKANKTMPSGLVASVASNISASRCY
jgi:hypothetical protein